MPLLRCSRGHSWEVTEEVFSGSAGGRIACPSCGAEHETLAQPKSQHTSSMSGSGPSSGSMRFPNVPGYEILDILGEGGMGIVYKAKQTRLGRLVALKMIRGGQADERHLARFRTEAESVARLRHEGIVRIHEVGEHDGQPYLSLEFISGGSLQDRIRESLLEPRQAAGFVRKLADAIQAAHSANVIHRDLKPANVLLEMKGDDFDPKVTDFGLAKKLEDASGVTQSGMIMGTPSYMAPEQARGSTKEIGPPADIYALGAILYECVTGRPPFRGLSPTLTLYQVLEREPVPPSQLNPGVNRDLETIVLKCLRKEAWQRYATASDLGDDLGRFLEGRPILARPIGPLRRTWRWCRRNPAVAALLVLVMSVLSGGIAVSTRFALDANDERDEAKRQADLAEKAQQGEKKKAEEASTNLTAARENAAKAVKETENALREQENAEREKKRAELETDRATRSEARMGRLLYGSTIAAAQRSWTDGDLTGMRIALESLAPTTPAEPDRRGIEWSMLYALAYPDVQVIRPRGDRVAFSHDGRFVVAEEGAGVVVRDTANWLQKGKPHQLWDVHALSVSSDGSRAASAKEQTVLVHDTATGAVVGTIRPGATASVVLLSPDGKHAATLTSDATVRVWDVATGRELFRRSVLSIVPQGLAFQSDGKLLAVADVVLFKDPRGDAPRAGVRLFEVPDGKELPGLRGSGEHPGPIAFSPQGRRLVGTGDTGIVKVWDLPENREVAVLPGHSSRIDSLFLLQDGRTLLTGGRDRLVHVWDIVSGRIVRTMRGHDGPVTTVAEIGAGYGTFSTGTGLRIWRRMGGWESEDRYASPEVQTARLRFNGDGSMSAVSEGSAIRLSPRNGPSVVWTGDSRDIRDISFAFDGTKLLVLTGPSTLILRSVVDKNKVQPFYTSADQVSGFAHHAASGATAVALAFGPAPGQPARLRLLLGENVRESWSWTAEELEALNSPIFSEDGKYLAVGLGLRGDVLVFETAKGRLLHRLRGHRAPVTATAFHPREPLLASASMDRTIRIWNVETGTETATLRGHGDPIHALAFDRTGERLASGGEDKLVKLWDVRTAQELLTLRGHPHQVRSVAFEPGTNRLFSLGPHLLRSWRVHAGPTSRAIRLRPGPGLSRQQFAASPAGGILAACEKDDILVWTFPGLVPRGIWNGHEALGELVVLSPDGKWMASVGRNPPLALWDVRTGKSVPIPIPPKVMVTILAFSPDGSRFHFADSAGVLRTYDIETKTLKEVAKGPVIARIIPRADGRTIFVCRWDGRLLLLDLETGKEQLLTSVPPGKLIQSTISPDGRLVAASLKNDEVSIGTIQIFDVVQGNMIFEMTTRTPMPIALCLEWHPQGKLLATGHVDGSIHLWDTTKGVLQTSLREHDRAVHQLMFAHDGRSLLSRGEDGEIKLWNLDK